jgi:hypothetical protein
MNFFLHQTVYSFCKKAYITTANEQCGQVSAPENNSLMKKGGGECIRREVQSRIMLLDGLLGEQPVP